MYIAMVNTRDSTQGMVKIWETKAIAIRHGKRLVRHSWDIVNPGHDKPEKEVVVPKVAKHPRRQDIVHRPTGPLLWTDIANRGFLSY